MRGPMPQGLQAPYVEQRLNHAVFDNGVMCTISLTFFQTISIIPNKSRVSKTGVFKTFPEGKRNFSPHWLWHPPSLLPSGYKGSPFPKVNGPQRDDNHSPSAHISHTLSQTYRLSWNFLTTHVVRVNLIGIGTQQSQTGLTDIYEPFQVHKSCQVTWH